MKKTLLLILSSIALWGMPCVMAQEPSISERPRHYVQFSIGDPLFNQIYSSTGWYSDQANEWFKPDVYDAAYSLLPTFSLSYYYAVKPWLHVGGEVYVAGEYHVVHDRISNQRKGVSGTTSLSVLPTIRFQYLNRPLVGLYSGLSLGLYMAMEQGVELYDPDDYNDFYLLPAFQLTALGVRVGNQVYGFAEIGVGNKGIANIGIGVHF